MTWIARRRSSQPMSKWKYYYLVRESGVEWLGEVPTHWSLKPLKCAVTFQRGHDLPLEQRTEGEVPVVSSAGITAWHNQGHRIKIGGLGRMVNSAFGGKLNLCGTCAHLFTMFVVYLVVDNKYNVYVR
jgi:hypothetical protein